ncbi:hypothetical protein [Leptolyngbya ohadii]|nr:hypothetical protein [Leptolyngbya ohadii]
MINPTTVEARTQLDNLIHTDLNNRVADAKEQGIPTRCRGRL